MEAEHQYLYQGSSKPVYISLQQDTFKIQPQKACLDVYLADGRNIRLDIKTSDTAERILEVFLCGVLLTFLTARAVKRKE